MILVPLTALAWVVAIPARAQEVRAGAGAARSRSLVDAYRDRRDALVRRVVVERDSLTRLAATERVAYGVAAVRGRLTLLTSSRFVDSAAHALAAADSLLRGTAFDGATDERVTLRLHPGWGIQAADTVDRVHWYLEQIGADGGEKGLDWWSQLPRSQALGVTIASKEEARLHERLPVAFRNWLNGRTLPLRSDDRWPSVYLALATSPTVVSRSCLLGNLPACRQALLIDQPANPLMEWFTPGARRAMVRPWLDGARAAATQPVDEKFPGAITACVMGGDDAACVKVILSEMDSASFGDPLNNAAGREALIVTAIEMPGAPGLRAIIGRTGLGLHESLTSISGTTIDAVVLRWHQRVMASEPDTAELPAPRLLSALAWTLAFCACALGGSRWRSV